MTTNTRERADLLESLARHRYFLTHTVRGLTDEQARRRSSPPSELTPGGLIKHVSATEAQWADFVVRGPEAMAMTPESYQAHLDAFVLGEGETLADVLDGYAAVAARTDELVRTVDLDAEQPLPEAPWFEPGAAWSARRVFLHVIAETAQHAGHADFLREAIDGQKTMG
ncbi:hypothetical protein FHX74_003550 [Friedmanniella endophytica]|uniref:DinB family protein n=1 Tax=Microlunatus kandeliicorticis TaxID=1759536 RepID=A0A7W3IVD1_9ACTN|nr:DinB family protein [Microlunatus kandeliicorticis]MBA8795909.1 hypothetical protein [Microlunatus kandeliicorticis]